MRLLLTEDSNEDVCPSHFTAARRLNMEDGALKYTLETQCRLGFARLIAFWDERRCLVDKNIEFISQSIKVRFAG